MQPESTTYPFLLGRPILSVIRDAHPDVRPMDLRKSIAASSLASGPDGFPLQDRLPEYYGTDYPIVARMPRIGDVGDTPSKKIPVNYGKPVAIIGAGAAGLCAGYELMKCGLTPVFFQFPTGGDTQHVRPGGRAYSYEFPSVGGGKKTVADMGCMRFPKTHTTLRAYVDFFARQEEYQYASAITSQWATFRDPLLVSDEGDSSKAKVVYDTVLFARGVNKRQFLRINSGTLASQLPKPLIAVADAFNALLYGNDGNAKHGVLNPIIAAYTKPYDPGPAIAAEWKKLTDFYQDKSIFEVLRDDGWETNLPDEGDGASLLDIFGEVGLGSGGFDAFWGTTFMEILRIKLHGDETGQDAFVGGSSYMLRPFLTHKAGCADVSGKDVEKSLMDVSAGRVVPSPVNGILPHSGGGVSIRCDDGISYIFPCAILTASPTAISSSIYIDEGLFSPGAWNGIRRMPLTGCGKICAVFDEPFWNGASGDIVTTVTDEAIRQVYTFDDYHWGSGSPAGVLMMSYTWGDWAHKMGSMSAPEQVQSAMRMLQSAYGPENYNKWIGRIRDAINNEKFTAINWSHERGFAGGYRMADLNRYPDQEAMAVANRNPHNPKSPLYLAGEAVAWLGLSGWIEGALHTGINATHGVLEWFWSNGESFDWGQVTKVDGIKGLSFLPPSHPGNIPFKPPSAAD